MRDTEQVTRGELEFFDADSAKYKEMKKITMDKEEAKIFAQELNNWLDKIRR